MLSFYEDIIPAALLGVYGIRGLLHMRRFQWVEPMYQQVIQVVHIHIHMHEQSIIGHRNSHNILNHSKV